MLVRTLCAQGLLLLTDETPIMTDGQTVTSDREHFQSVSVQTHRSWGWVGWDLVVGLDSLRNISILATARCWRRDHLRSPHD